MILFNHHIRSIKISKGDRIAQLILEKYYDAEIELIEEFSEEEDNERGKSGFGSTGVTDKDLQMRFYEKEDNDKPLDLSKK